MEWIRARLEAIHNFSRTWITQCINYLICWPRRSTYPVPIADFPSIREFWIQGLRIWHLGSTSDRLILLCHGNKRHLGNLIPLIRFFQALHWDVVLFDYHGFGQSTSHPTMYSAAGMTANIYTMVTWVRQHLPGKRLFIHGHSLGGALVIRALTHYTLPVDGVILEGTFYCLEDVVAYHLNPYLLPCLVSSIICGLYWLVPQIFDEYRTSDRLDDVTHPMTLIHSRDDQVIPITQLDLITQHNPTWPVFRITGTHAEPMYSHTCQEYLQSM